MPVSLGLVRPARPNFVPRVPIKKIPRAPLDATRRRALLGSGGKLRLCFRSQRRHLVRVRQEGALPDGSERVNSSLYPMKPSVNIALKNSGRQWNTGRYSDHRGLRRSAFLQEPSASKRILPIGGDDGSLAGPALVRIAHTPVELLKQPPAPLLVLAGPIGRGVQMDLHRRRPASLGAHGDQPETQHPAQFANISMLPVPKAGPANTKGNINIVGHCLATHALEHELQGEGGLQLDNDRIFIAPYRHDIAVGHLTLHAIALCFKESLDGRIEVGFAREAWARKTNPGRPS